MGLPRQSVKPFDPDTPSVARVWDYWLGGNNNFPADRELAEKMLEINPLAAQMAQENRQFLGRAVSYVARRGVRQFIDIGAGLPTAPSTHDSVQQADPGATVAYVDNDPIVIAYSRVLLAMTQGVVVVPGDMRHPAAILTDTQLTSVIDLVSPVCVLLSGVLHFLDAEEARDVAIGFTRAVAPGSYVIISVGTGQGEVAGPFTAAYSPAPLYVHGPDEIMTFFDGLELVPPGLVPARDWHGGAAAPRAGRQAAFLAGVGRRAPGPTGP